ncbi:hypothetical protein A4R44_02828 [Amycolatopsis sp. M39]|nr:hypothetical protein A4R44_02828 [Amycolatopsis sp. M39]
MSASPTCCAGTVPDATSSRKGSGSRRGPTPAAPPRSRRTSPPEPTSIGGGNHCSPARFPRLRSIMDSTVDNVKARGKSALLACFASRQEDYSDQVMLVPQVGFAVVDRVDCRSAGGHGLRLFCSRQRARGPSHSDRIKFRSSEAASRRLSECISTRNRSAACTVSPCSRPIWQPNKRTLAAEAEAARLAEVPGNSAGRFAKTWDHVDVAQQGVSGDPVVDQ